ncbi:transporter, partial [Klebsiella pneumoniae]|nr:transporter [Klebsiella pneumoniae]
AAYANSFSFGLFAAGFLTTYVFSRLYGRQDFWRAVLQENYLRDFKSAAEELVELFGYALLLIAVIELVLLARRWALARKAG